MTHEEALDEITARLTGWDPKMWFDPERATIAYGGKSWLIIHKNSALVMFETEEQAWHFKRTGVKPDDL